MVNDIIVVMSSLFPGALLRPHPSTPLMAGFIIVLSLLLQHWSLYIAFRRFHHLNSLQNQNNAHVYTLTYDYTHWDVVNF